MDQRDIMSQTNLLTWRAACADFHLSRALMNSEPNNVNGLTRFVDSDSEIQVELRTREVHGHLTMLLSLDMIKACRI